MAAFSQTTEVCRCCHKRNPRDISLLTLRCRSLEEHNQRDKVSVTEDCGVLITIRPLPREYRPSGFFQKCCNDQDTCRFYPDCMYPHSEAEKNVWNTLLRDERKPPQRQRQRQYSSSSGGIHLDTSGKRYKKDAIEQPKVQPTSSSVKTISNPPVQDNPHHIVPDRDTYWKRQECPPPIKDMMLPVNLKHYKRKYRALLYYEEKEHVEVLKAKCDGWYELTITRNVPNMYLLRESHDCYGYISGMASRQIMYTTQASNGNVTIIYRGIQCKARLLSCNNKAMDEKLYIGFNGYDAKEIRTKLRSYSSTNVFVNFEVNHSYFDDLNDGVCKISSAVLKRILPTSDHFKCQLEGRKIPKRKYPELDLDPEQYPALQVIINSQSSAPVLVPGPFGCGKTRILAVATEYFIRQCKESRQRCCVLICCHHQHSADIFMDDYFEKMLTNRKSPWEVEVVRVTNNIHRIHSPRYVTAADFRDRLFTRMYHSKPYVVVVSTFGGALRMSKVVPSDFFTHILIDEGAQTREPEALSPLIMANANTRIIIAGDCQQVGPNLVVLGEEPQRSGLGVSLLQRLHDQYVKIGGIAKQHVASLNVNYRSHAALLDLPSKLFYESKLIPCYRVPYHLEAPYPLMFISSTFENIISPNMDNEIEAKLLLCEVHRFAKYKSWELKDICIMTTNLKQAFLIRKLINVNPEHTDIRGVNVITSYQMQGQEYRLLFMSTVESLESSGRPFDLLKSFCHPALFNTAITRSKSLVVAVGNPLVLMMSEATMGEPKWCWREFISRCLEHKTFISCKEVFYRIERQFYNLLRSRNPTEISSLFHTISLPHASEPNTSLKLNTSQKTVSEKTMLRMKSNSTPEHSPTTKESTIQGKSSSQSCSQPTLSHPSLPVIQDKPLPMKQKSKENPKTQCSIPASPSPQVVRSLPSQAKKKPSLSHSLKVMQPRHQISSNVQFTKNSTKGFKQQSFFFKHNHQAYDKKVLESCLTRENYKRKFHQLLCREEEEHERILQERCDGNYTLTVLHNYYNGRQFRDAKDKHEKFGKISGGKLDGDVMAYAKQASEGIVIIELPKSGEQVQAELVTPKLKDAEAMYIGFTAQELSTMCKHYPETKTRSKQLVIHEIRISFILKYSYFDRLHRAIDNLPSEIVNKIIISSKDNFTPNAVMKSLPPPPLPIKCVSKIVQLDLPQGQNQTLPNPQMTALTTIMNCESHKAPVLVIGSFGTGKTRLLARTAYQILQNDHNSHVLICAHHQASADAFIECYFGKMYANRWYIKAHRLVPNENYNYNPMYALHYSTSKKLCKERLDEVRLVVTTFSTSLHLLGHVHKGFFTHILLDEGAQTREPESIAPLCLADTNTKIVIAGDHKQVGPSLLVLGDIAIKHGLNISLLERLHLMYSQKTLYQFSKTHCATLLTNFRCHHALLSLPSCLFYQSALITVAEASSSLHPKAKYPVHFLCSNLSNETEVTESINMIEIELLLQEVLKYVNDWPTIEWGEKDLSKICIMATTANQKYMFSKEIKSNKKYEQLSGTNEDGFVYPLIDVLTVFDIQGREYEAVFLSTAEPTTVEGRSKNPTKTPCSQHVFNTALTRAKSLVVCAGNPFLLMKIEEHINNECSCWKDYIRRCVLSKTFHVPSKVSRKAQCTQNSLKHLQEKIFPLNVTNSYTDEEASTKDSILKSYKQAGQKILQYKYCKKQIKDVQSESTWGLVNENDDPIDTNNDQEDETATSEIVTCELQIKNQHSAIALLVGKGNRKTITINGYNYRKGAFNGDIVRVQIIGKQTNEEGVVDEYGRVVKVIEARHPTKYICRADQYSVINFYPLDKCAPGIVNLPKISQNLLQYNSQIVSASQKDFITVFKEESLPLIHQSGDNKLPQIKELVPYSMSQSLLFVVQVLGWAPKKYRKPLGAVVEALPCTTNLFFTERLLKISHSIEDNIEHDPILTTPEGDHYDRAFTIDPPGAKDLDDAISLVPLQEHNTYKLAVLITNVAKYIPKEHELNKIAQRRGTSVYGGDTVVHMLPHNIITQSFSLNYNTTRDALAVTATVVIKERNVIEVICNGCPEIAQVTSQAQLTYKSAQNLMDGKPIEFEEMKKQITDYDAKQDGMSMVDTLKLLYQIAMKLRVDRLNDAAYSYDVSEPGEEDCWQTHFIIEELMIWTNAAIAEYLKESLPEMALVRYQLPPQQEDVIKIQKIYENVTGHSFALKRYSVSNDNLSPLYITTSILEQLHRAYNKGDYNKVRWLLFADKLYPQLAIVHNELRSINNIATYSLIDESENQSHYSLCLEAYTHFTSPIRRYFDLLLQRLVIALLNKHNITYSQDELKQICNHLNLKSKMAKEFERTYNNVLLTRSCEATSQRAQAFLSRSTIKPNKFELYFPSKEFKSIRGQDICFSYSDLNYCSMDDQYITWHITSTSLRHGSSIVLNSNIGDFSPVNNTHLSERPQSYVQAMIYHHFDDNKQHLKCSNFLATILSDVVSIEADKWKLIQESLKSLSGEQLLSVHKFIPECFSQKTLLKKSHYSLFSESPVVVYDVTRRFSPGEIVDVWLGKSLKQSLPSPGLQLIEIAPTVRVCIQHNQSPALCFSDIQLHKASQEQYHSISEYVKLWSKVLVAEAANECVKTKELTLLHDATLQWPNLIPVDNCIDDVHYKPNGKIILEIPETKLESLEFIEIKSGDFVCARYEIPTQEKTLHAVYHFVVTRRFSKEQDSKKSECIYMLAEGDESCRISECIAKHLSNRCKPLTCDIQIISMPDSFHRVYARLKDGSHIVKNSSEKASKWSELSQNVAQGVKSFPTVPAEEKMTALQIMKTDPLACQIWDSGVQLNDLQKEAVERSLKNKFQLIQGPPGTGKSVTGAHLAYVFSRQNKALYSKKKALYVTCTCVLYCGPSNKAVDVVHEKLQLLNTKFRDPTQKIKVLRLYGRTHERQDFPDPCHNLKKVKEGNIESRCLKRFHNDALHYKIRKTSPEIVKIETEFNLLLEKGLIPSSIQRKEYKDIIKMAEMKEIMMDYDIVLCTCNETCSQRLLTLAEKGRIAQCIVDECGMANEPETIAAASLCDHVVLIGDHKQLQPIIKYSPAKECGLGISLFERYASMIERSDNDQFKNHLITLQIQYRMHPFICKGPSQCFYDGLLEADEKVVHRAPLTPKLMSFWRKRNCPIIFYDLIGKEEKNIICDEPHQRNIDSHSISNKKEANFVLKCVKRLQRCHAVKYEDITILTPYKAQKELLKKMVKKDDELMSWVNPRIATIVESQGDEYNIVILTTVRSLPISEIKCRKFVQPDRKWMRENLGFLTDEHQVNVGITRAKYGLIIVGNFTLLKYDETWTKLIELYSQKNCLELVEESCI